MFSELIKGRKKNAEIKRLEQIQPEFMAEYMTLCKKYSAQLIAIVRPLGEEIFKVEQRLDTYKPVENKTP